MALAVEKKSALTIEREGACMKQMCELCAKVSDMCATECAKHAHVHCKDCAQASAYAALKPVAPCLESDQPCKLADGWGTAFATMVSTPHSVGISESTLQPVCL